MKILLTGATGFLGKKLLDLLLDEKSVSRIDVVSRRKVTHPHPKVNMLKLDLTDPSCINSLSPDTDAVIHLAGLYDFKESYSKNYIQNVVPVLNLLNQTKVWSKVWNEKKPIPFFYTSTYAVGYGLSKGIKEDYLTEYPPRTMPYSYTKALADKAVTDSGLCGAVMRLGILVGTTQTGEIEKMDGPYALMRLLYRLRKMQRTPLVSQLMTQLMKRVPIPAREKGVLPLVPVNIAAQACFEIFLRTMGEIKNKNIKPMHVFGVYDSSTAHVRDICKFLLHRLLPGSKPLYIKNVNSHLLKVQSYVTGISEEIFRFSLNPIPLEATKFKQLFPNCPIPPFEDYREKLIEGFINFMEGRPS